MREVLAGQRQGQAVGHGAGLRDRDSARRARVDVNPGVPLSGRRRLPHGALPLGHQFLGALAWQGGMEAALGLP